ncbi:hypothetical protein Tco_0317151 [Tanacetum coccineum]
MSNRHQELASPEQTVSGKDFLNPLIVDSLLKTIWFINAPCFRNKALAIPGQTATGKELSNPLMANSLPKTILSTKLVMRLSIRSWVTEWKGLVTTASSLEAEQDSGKTFGRSAQVYNKEEKGKGVISYEEADLVSEDPSKQGRMSRTKFEDVKTEHAEEVEYILEQIKRFTRYASKDVTEKDLVDDGA